MDKTPKYDERSRYEGYGNPKYESTREYINYRARKRMGRLGGKRGRRSGRQN